MSWSDSLLLALGGVVPGLSPRQIQIESGGEHRWTSGPKKGQVKVSPKGAVGIAQVMPETGPEAARDAGLPWDPVRFRNDPKYNRLLGEAYQRKLERRFGDETIATAAYNAGPTRVQKALNRAAKTGGDWRDYIPRETQDYIGYKSKSGGRQVASVDPYYGGIMTATNMEVGPPTKGETARFSDDEPDVLKISSGVDESKVRAGVQTYGEYTDRYMKGIMKAIPQLTQKAEAVAAETRNIAQTKENLANDFASRAAALEASIIPLQQRRQAILNRLDELDAMNPLERRLKSAFNSDYDDRALRGRLEKVQNRLEGYQASYDELNKIRSGVAVLAVEAEAADITVLDAESKAILADTNLMGQAISAIGQNIDASLLPFQLQVKTLELQTRAKQALVGNATTEMLTQWTSEARESPNGLIIVDGMELSLGELEDASQASQQQDLSFRSLINATRVNDLQTANTIESEVLSRMTAEQLQEAIKNGGNYKGHQFPIDKLVAAQAARTELNQQNVNEVLLNTAEGQAAGTLRGLSNNFKLYGTRVKEMFGHTPSELAAFSTQTAVAIKNWQKGFEEAKGRGVEREYIASTIGTVNAIQKGLDEQIDSLAKRWAGGRKPLYAVSSAYLRGQPLNGEDAVKGLIAIARSGMPAGAKMTGPALAAIQTATAIVRQFDSPANQPGGTDVEALLKGGSAKEKEAEMERRVQQAVGAVYADNLTNAIFNELPVVARNIRDENSPGKIHPFARITKDEFLTAVRHGDSEAYNAIGNKYGLDPQQTQKMFAEGVDGAIWQAVKKEKGLNDGQFNDEFARLQALQMTGLLQALDANKRSDGFSPAKAFVDFIRNPEARQQISTLARNYGGSGFGAFIVSNAAGGGFNDAWDNYAEGLQAAYTQLNATTLRETISQQKRLFSDPYARMGVILNTMNISKPEQQILMEATRAIVPARPSSEPAPPEGKWHQQGLDTRILSSRDFDKLTYVILNHKFEDPAVEKIRKRAAAKWNEMSAVVDRIREGI